MYTYLCNAMLVATTHGNREIHINMKFLLCLEKPWNSLLLLFLTVSASSFIRKRFSLVLCFYFSCDSVASRNKKPKKNVWPQTKQFRRVKCVLPSLCGHKRALFDLKLNEFEQMKREILYTRRPEPDAILSWTIIIINSSAWFSNIWEHVFSIEIVSPSRPASPMIYYRIDVNCI